MATFRAKSQTPWGRALPTNPGARTLADAVGREVAPGLRLLAEGAGGAAHPAVDLVQGVGGLGLAAAARLEDGVAGDGLQARQPLDRVQIKRLGLGGAVEALQGPGQDQ